MLSVCVAVCCSVLQCVAVCCSVLKCALINEMDKMTDAVSMYCSVLQCVAACCSVMQCVAVRTYQCDGHDAYGGISVPLHVCIMYVRGT